MRRWLVLIISEIMKHIRPISQDRKYLHYVLGAGAYLSLGGSVIMKDGFMLGFGSGMLISKGLSQFVVKENNEPHQ